MGVAIGVVAIIAIQSFSPLDENATQDTTNRDVQQSSTKKGDTASITGTGEVEQLQEIFKHRTVFDQNLVLFATLSTANELELNDWWLQSQKIERKSQREFVQDAILRKLTVMNPQAALRHIDNVSIFQTDALLWSVFSEWSALDLDGAIDAATFLSGPRRDVALQAILETRDDLSENKGRSIAKRLDGEDTFRKLVSDTKASASISEPKESWDILLNDDVDDSRQTESLGIVAEAWREQVGFEVLSNIYHTEIENYQIKLQLVRAIAQVDLTGALEYTRGLIEEEKQYLSRIIVVQWASRDAPAALAAVSTFEPPSLASRLEKDIAITWSRSNPNEAIENIGAVTEEYRIETLESAFSQIASHDPLEAISKISEAENYVGNTSTIVQRIVLRWSLQEPDAAADWVVNHYEQDDPLRRTLLEDVLPQLARQDPNKAFELAVAQPTPSAGLGLEYVVIAVITRENDIELALKLLPRVHENSKSAVYGNVAAAMVREARTKEALELGKDLEESQQGSFYSQVFREWTDTNPNNLYESLEDLPTSMLKSRAAMQLILGNRYEPVLSDERINHIRTLLNSEDEANLKRIENR